jgi:hypothetical protein
VGGHAVVFTWELFGQKAEGGRVDICLLTKRFAGALPMGEDMMMMMFMPRAGKDGQWVSQEEVPV